VAEKVNLVMTGIEKYKMIQIYDMAGKAHPLSSIQTRSDLIEIDMNHLSSGHYFIRVILEDRSEIVQIIKQ
jgi:hypothetical protein